MKHFRALATVALTVLFVGLDAWAMTAEPTKLTVWRRGEGIGGEEFVAANEAIVDYIATLRRPTEALGRIRYNCMAKYRVIRPSLQGTTGTGANQGYVVVNTVYELRDCVEASE